MSDEKLLTAICEIRDLVRLIAEPQIAARDQKLRDELTRIVGIGEAKRKAVLTMDGSSTQMEIHKQTGVNAGNLSTLIKQLGNAGLLSGDPKKPKLAISIPGNFFEQKGRSQ
ncbi:MAG: hypothetical protein QOE70_1935 [Chthoniobacter sp.]|jgi:hypothetical protein|nr:hypothetical protein [Chthoniobacter sp.]